MPPRSSPPQHRLHRHPKGRGEAREHPDDAHRFFAEVATTLADVDALLIVGPSSAKLEFFKSLHEHDRKLESTGGRGRVGGSSDRWGDRRPRQGRLRRERPYALVGSC